jgi:HAD superfamily hydrolase (TIGR01549 family)
MAIKEKLVSNIFFDFGGVLGNSRKLGYGCIDRLHYNLQTLKIRIPPSELERMVINGDAEYERFRNETEKDVIPASLRVCRYYLRGWQLNEKDAEEAMCMIENAFSEPFIRKDSTDDAESVLRELKSRNYRLGLISNTKSDRVKRLMRGSGLSEFMETEVYSSDVGFRKPRLEIFNAALNDMGVKAEESAYIGDTIYKDALGALKAGFNVVVLFRKKGDIIVPLPENVQIIGNNLNYILNKFPSRW